VSQNSVTLVVASGLSLSAPILFASAGELISETAGVLNIELEGMMLNGAFAGVIAALYAHNVIVGFAAAAAAGIFVASVQGLLCFICGVNQVVSGIVLNILVLGGTAYGIDAILKNSVNRSANTLHPVHIPGLSNLPFLGPVLFRQNVGVLIALVLFFAVWFFLRSSLGLPLKAVGERPSAADALGVSVGSTQWLALVVCGGLAGIGGGQLTLGSLGVFTPDITAGAGFIALAAVIFGRWSAAGTVAAVLLFAITEAFAIHAQTLGIDVPYQLLVGLPYVVTLLALALGRSSSLGPRSLGVTYQKA
jgi:general nucleoside transport system permease protein